MNKEGLYLRVVELVKKGYSYRDVGRELGISHGKVGCIMESNQVAEHLHGDLLKKREELEKLRGKKEECDEQSREAEKVADEEMMRVDELLGKKKVLMEAISGLERKRRYKEERYIEFKRLEEEARLSLSRVSNGVRKKTEEFEALNRKLKAKEEERKNLEEMSKGMKKVIEELTERGMWVLQTKALEVFPLFSQEMRVRMVCTLSDDDLIELIELVCKQRGLPLSWWVPSPPLKGLRKKKKSNSLLANLTYSKKLW